MKETALHVQGILSKISTAFSREARKTREQWVTQSKAKRKDCQLRQIPTKIILQKSKMILYSQKNKTEDFIAICLRRDTKVNT
jgi:hypothetical protein